MALRASVGLALLLAASCDKAKDTPPEPPGLGAVVEELGSAGEASACKPDGSACERLVKGAKLETSSVIKCGPAGRVRLRFDPATTLTLGESETALDARARTIEVRRGSAALSRAGAGASGELRLNVRDRQVVVTDEGEVGVSLRVHGSDVADVSVDRGRITLSSGSESVELHAGESARVTTGHAADRRAGWSRQSSFLRASFEGARAPSSEPRGFGRMTARLPGQSAVVSGVRLASHRVRAVVRDGFARTEVEEEFENETSQVLEGRYVFPIPPGASISRLALWVGDELMEGEIVEKKRAAAIFKGIVDDTVRPRDPALLEWVTGGEFSLKIFPIPAKGRRKVLLAYDQTLPSEGGRARYVYPLSLGADRATKIDQLSVRVTVSDTRRAPLDVTTPLYPAKIQNGNGAVTASFEASGFTPAADFVVDYATERPAALELSAYVPKWGGLRTAGFDTVRDDADGGFAVLRLGVDLPDESATPAWTRRDRIIAIDTSHSQSKETLEGERLLALSLLRRMGDGERFALLACDAACVGFPEQGLASASEEQIAAAESWLAKATPQGASDLAGALLAAARRAEPNAPAQLVYVGDGAPSAGELSAERIAQVVSPALANKKLDLRLLGAGRTLDEVVLDGLARSLGGSYEPVANGEPLSERIERVAGDLRRPLITGAKLELPPGLRDPYPAKLPTLRLGRELVVVAKLDSDPKGSVKLSGTLDGKRYEIVRRIEWSEAPERQNPLVPRLWAAARIAELEASASDESVKELIELSKRFHVMSRATSLLVLESSQMFAEFGIRQTGPQSVGAAPMPESAAQRLSKELESLEMFTVGAAGGAGRGVPLDAAPSGIGGVGSPGSSARVEPPRGTVNIGGAQVAGGSVSNASRVVAGMRAGFRACYQRALAADPTIKGGSARIVAQIAADGSVASATPSASGLPTSVVGCVTARVRAAQFDPPEGGAATIAIPITFKLDTSPRPAMPAFPGTRPGPMQPRDSAVHRAADEAWTSAGEEALVKLRKALETQQESRRKHDALIRGLLARGRFAEALTGAKHFAELDPDLPLARELLSYAAAATGDQALALASVGALVETDSRNPKAQTRAARALEAVGDEARACAHWRALAELTPRADEALYQALRCRSRALADREGALAQAKAVEKPGKLVQSLIPLLESGDVPAHEKLTGSLGSFEATVTCVAGVESCPSVLVITPAGVVLSPWTPGGTRASRSSVSFSGLSNGTYRTLIVGGAPGSRGEVEIRAAGNTAKFAFSSGGLRTIAATDVRVADSFPVGWGFGIAPLDWAR